MKRWSMDDKIAADGRLSSGRAESLSLVTARRRLALKNVTLLTTRLSDDR
jgi:hypothetical protein